MEPTLTQNCALYYAQHKTSKRRATFFQRFRAVARKQGPDTHRLLTLDERSQGVCRSTGTTAADDVEQRINRMQLKKSAASSDVEARKQKTKRPRQVNVEPESYSEATENILRE
jgi:hypothetical protein